MELLAGVEVYKMLYQGVPASSPATVYTAPGSTTAFVKSIHAVNTSGTDQTFALYRNGLANANRITPEIALQANGWAEYGEDGWKIYGPVSPIGTVETPGGTALLMADIEARQALGDLALVTQQLVDRALLSAH